MSDHDAASIVGQLAGLTPKADPSEKITPEQLIRRFCGDSVTESDGVKTARGHCGYTGVGGRGDGLALGFDDGYDFMGYLHEHGWGAIADKGDWPYVVFMVTRHEDGYAVAEYCEADLVVTVLAKEKARAFYARLPDAP